MTRGDEPPLLTFQWRERDRPLMRLAGFTLVSLGAAAGFFLLFRVVYPQARHFSTAPQQVLMLNDSQAATRDIVNRTRDRNFLLLEAGPAGSDRSDESSLFPVFRPSFSGYEMKLMDLPGEPDKRSLPRVFNIEDMPLPPPATVMKARSSAPPARPGTRTVPRVVLHGALAGRKLESSARLNDTAGLADLTAIRFLLGVNSKGAVGFALPLEGGPDAKQMRLLHKAVSSLRFRPASDTEVQWGQATFAWEEVTP